MKKLHTNGDTIIEVLLALTLLSAILFTSWAIINRSSQINNAARKRIVMVNKVKQQAEVLKSIYATNTTAVTGRTFGRATALPVVPINTSFAARVPANPCDTAKSGGLFNPYRGFYFDETGAAKTWEENTNQTSEEAVWIQIVQGTGYLDFYIRACWQSGSGAKQKDDNTHIIVRLNT